jgi:DNA-binding transcriptional MerR regulator
VTVTIEDGVAERGIREVSELTGVSMDTLRWYEKEGVLPVAPRTADGRRMYSPGAVRFVLLVQALRRTGMPVSEVRRFVELGPGTPNNSALRMEVLRRQAAEVEERLERLREDQRRIRAKIENYEDLIARGVDCEDGF